MTSIGSVQNTLAQKLAQQRAAEMNSAMVSALFQTPANSGNSPSVAETGKAASGTQGTSASTGVMQPPLSSPTVTALLSASQEQASSLSASTAKQYSHVSDDEQNLPDAAKEFLDYARETPAEKMEDEILKEEGLTKEDLAKMDPAKREAIMKEIAEKIKERMKEQMEGNSNGVKDPAEASAAV